MQRSGIFEQLEVFLVVEPGFFKTVQRKVFDKPTELVTRDKEQNIYSYNV